jgi:hypothetical protein
VPSMGSLLQIRMNLVALSWALEQEMACEALARRAGLAAKSQRTVSHTPMEVSIFSHRRRQEEEALGAVSVSRTGQHWGSC